MNGIGTATTERNLYGARDYQRPQTRTEGFGRALADASGGDGKRDAYIRAGVTKTAQSSCEYANYGPGLSGLSLREGEISSTSGLIGLSFVRGSEEPMSARMDQCSTEEDPVVLVQIGSG